MLGMLVLAHTHPHEAVAAQSPLLQLLHCGRYGRGEEMGNKAD